jgi:hypothetical protein
MKVTVKQPTQNIVTAVGIQGPSGVTRILDADDIDKTTLEDGAVLVYKAQTSKITTTRLLSQQVIEAGQY